MFYVCLTASRLPHLIELFVYTDDVAKQRNTDLRVVSQTLNCRELLAEVEQDRILLVRFNTDLGFLKLLQAADLGLNRCSNLLYRSVDHSFV